MSRLEGGARIQFLASEGRIRPSQNCMSSVGLELLLYGVTLWVLAEVGRVGGVKAKLQQSPGRRGDKGGGELRY